MFVSFIRSLARSFIHETPQLRVASRDKVKLDSVVRAKGFNQERNEIRLYISARTHSYIPYMCLLCVLHKGLHEEQRIKQKRKMLTL